MMWLSRLALLATLVLHCSGKLRGGDDDDGLIYGPKPAFGPEGRAKDENRLSLSKAEALEEEMEAEEKDKGDKKDKKKEGKEDKEGVEEDGETVSSNPDDIPDSGLLPPDTAKSSASMGSHRGYNSNGELEAGPYVPHMQKISFAMQRYMRQLTLLLLAKAGVEVAQSRVGMMALLRDEALGVEELAYRVNEAEDVVYNEVHGKSGLKDLLVKDMTRLKTLMDETQKLIKETGDYWVKTRGDMRVLSPEQEGGLSSQKPQILLDRQAEEEEEGEDGEKSSDINEVLAPLPKSEIKAGEPEGPPKGEEIASPDKKEEEQ